MSWQLTEAKNRLGELVKAAKSEGPQIITVSGKEEVAVVSMEELRRLTPNKEFLYEFLRSSPLEGDELNIERSRDSEERDTGL